MSETTPTAGSNTQTKIKVKRVCVNCLFHYMIDLEDDRCFEEGGCKGFMPIGIRAENAEIIV